MIVSDKKFSLFIAAETIERRIVHMAAELSSDYLEKDPLFIVLLNGAFMFATDLIRNISIPCQVCFIKVASYEGMESTGNVRALLGLEEEVSGRHLIVLDDIVDTGQTMQHVIYLLKEKKPASIEMAALLLKPEAFGNQFKLKYTGFPIPNEFVVGFGLDYNGYGRNLKDIYHLKS